jgi:MFS family permease
MDDLISTERPDTGRSVQTYIDERPNWADGTPVAVTPMTAMQWRIWSLAAAGKFFEGLVVFMTGVALPLIAEEFRIGKVEHGLVSAASLFGILVGAIGLGGLSDHFGRRPMFIFEMIVFLAFLALVVVSPNFLWLILCLFGLGVALGCDYPVAHLMISESIPSAARGRLVLAAFGCQALGALTGTAVGFLVLRYVPEVGAWRWMYATALLPAAVVVLLRWTVTESAPWLLRRGRTEEATVAVQCLLTRTPPYPREVQLADPVAGPATDQSYGALFRGRNLRATVLASVPWFLQDLGTYGIGIFTPTILAAAFGRHTTHAHNLADLIGNDLSAAEGAAAIDMLLIIGILAAVALADRVGRIVLQVVGFVGCAAGLLIASLSAAVPGAWHMPMIFAGFMLFNLMTNLGPNAQTYLLAGEVFPTRIRGRGAGFAAAFAKIGGVTTAFLFPILLADLGTQLLLTILVGTSLLGAVITWRFRIETAGVNLETIEEPPGGAPPQPQRTRPTSVQGQHSP